MFTDYVLNGDGHGPVGEALSHCRFETGLLRPYYDQNGVPCVTINTGHEWNSEKKRTEKKYEKIPICEVQRMGTNSPVLNATSLRQQEWELFDTRIIQVARERLRAWSDLAGANSFGGFDGMSKTVLEWETSDDPGEALVDMDGLTEGRTDSPLYQLESIPLPITHSNFWFSSRRLAVSRNSGTPLDARMAEACARRVAEHVEKTLIGTLTGMTYGAQPTGARQTSTIYGYTNFPDRNTKTDMTAPTGSNGTTVLSDWLALRETLYGDNFFGPFMAYVSSGYAQYLDDEFKTNSDRTLRERLLAIDGIVDIRTLDFLTTSNVVILVQMTSDVARAIIGMPLTTVQWESQGGMRLNFKVMTIMVPQLFADYNGNCGIIHGTTA